MRAVRIHEHGGPEVLRLEEIARPDPGEREVRVAVRNAALNHMDLWVRKGVPGHAFPLPITPGCDAAGTVDAVGAGVTGLRPGDRVFLLPGYSCGACGPCLRGDDNLCRGYGILGEMRDGTCAESIVVPGVNVAPLPDGLSFEEGAAFGLVFLTAWNMLVRKARLQPGEWVVVHAAGGGVGTAAVQVAHLLGGRVIAVAGTPGKLEEAERLGASFGVSSRDPDWSRAVRRFTGGNAIDVVIDSVGQDTFEPSIRALARGGRYVTCGATSGYELATDFRRVYFKNIEILGSTMGRRGDLLRVAHLMESGRLRPVVDRVLPLEQVAEAHQVLESRDAFGKVVLTTE